MKKVGLIIVTCITITGFTQLHQHSLGLRFNSQQRWGPYLNYELGLSDRSRLALNLTAGGAFGEQFSQLQGSGNLYFQYVTPIKGGLNWYIGGGVGYQMARFNLPGQTQFYRNFSFGPQLGLEYDFNQFKLPLILAFDIKPSISFSSTALTSPNFNVQSGITLKYILKQRN